MNNIHVDSVPIFLIVVVRENHLTAESLPKELFGGRVWLIDDNLNIGGNSCFRCDGNIDFLAAYNNRVVEFASGNSQMIVFSDVEHTIVYREYFGFAWCQC